MEERNRCENKSELVSIIEMRLQEASVGVMAPIKGVDKPLRDELMNYFSNNPRYKVDENVLIDSKAIKMPTKYDLYIMRLN